MKKSKRHTYKSKNKNNPRATTTKTSNKNHIDELFQFLRIPGHELCINDYGDYNNDDDKRLSSIDDRYKVNDNDPVIRLRLIWNDNEFRRPIANDRFNLNILWELSNLQELELSRFPFASFTATQSNVNRPKNNNNNNNKNNNGDFDSYPISIGQLSKKLKKLKVRFCQHNHFHLPPDIGMLVNLTELHLVDCWYLKHLPAEIGGLQNLQIFKLDGSSNLKLLPAEIGNLMNLKVLQLYRCDSLVRLPKNIGRFKRLQELSIVCCDALEQVPINFNLLCGNLQKLEIRDNICLQPTGFSFQIGNFTKLRELIIQWDEYSKDGIAKLMLQSLPASLEALVLHDFNDKYLSIPSSHQSSTSDTTPASTLKLSSLLDLLPSNIAELTITNFFSNKISVNKENQHVIHTFLHTFPRLSIYIDSQYQTIDVNLQDDEDETKRFGLFTKETLHLMFFNRCGRVLTNSVSLLGKNPKQQPLLPLSMWPMVLGDVRKRIEQMKNNKSEQIIEASVIFSLLQEGPALLNSPRVGVHSHV